MPEAVQKAAIVWPLASQRATIAAGQPTGYPVKVPSGPSEPPSGPGTSGFASRRFTQRQRTVTVALPKQEHSMTPIRKPYAKPVLTKGEALGAIAAVLAQSNGKS